MPRILLALVLMVPLLVGALEAWVLGVVLLRPKEVGAFAILVGLIGSSSVFVCVWALWHVRTLQIWKLVALAILASVLATLGFGLVVGVAH